MSPRLSIALQILFCIFVIALTVAMVWLADKWGIL